MDAGVFSTSQNTHPVTSDRGTINTAKNGERIITTVSLEEEICQGVREIMCYTDGVLV